MKRFLPLLLCLLFAFGCGATANHNFESNAFSAVIPEPFERVESAGILCFAPEGDPLLSSSITVYTTELNWYFDSFSEEEYADALSQLTGYDSLSVSEVRSCKVDGSDARRIACTAAIDQGIHDLILYVVSADEIYVFTLLNRDSDNYIASFDDMMKSVRFKGQNR